MRPLNQICTRAATQNNLDCSGAMSALGHKLAELTGSSKSYIWELENKNPPRPSADKIGKIAAVLGVTGDYLMTTGLQVEDAVDEAFYRRYRQMDPETKKKFRHMVDLWGDDK